MIPAFPTTASVLHDHRLKAFLQTFKCFIVHGKEHMELHLSFGVDFGVQVQRAGHSLIIQHPQAHAS